MSELKHENATSCDESDEKGYSFLNFLDELIAIGKKLFLIFVAVGVLILSIYNASMGFNPIGFSLNATFLLINVSLVFGFFYFLIVVYFYISSLFIHDYLLVNFIKVKSKKYKKFGKGMYLLSLFFCVGGLSLLIFLIKISGYDAAFRYIIVATLFFGQALFIHSVCLQRI